MSVPHRPPENRKSKRHRVSILKRHIICHIDPRLIFLYTMLLSKDVLLLENWLFPVCLSFSFHSVEY